MTRAITRREALALLTAGSALGSAACVLPPPRLVPLAADAAPPEAPREFRGAWVASVANIDWPSASGLPEAEQRAQIERIVARAAALGLNALIVQVRPACDALYASALEPASEFLSGTQGMAPSYDPLALWIAAAHARGVELHAWFNPFRARHPSAKSPLAANHIGAREPGWVKAYGDALWLDPGERGAVAHTLAVIDDVVRRYDIDGVHIDDYFYPYPIKGPAGVDVPFPDEASYARAATALARDDWRRENVDRFVESLYERVHAAKPWVKVGISPFALPRRERRPGGIEGFDPYARLFADAERWLMEGWLDYVAPQLYWPMAQRAQAFDVLFEHWAATNARGRHLWPGLFTSRVGLAPNPWPPEEISAQLAHLRAQAGKSGGHIHFSMVALLDDRGGLASRIAAQRPPTALVPRTPWLGVAPPPRPLAAAHPGHLEIRAADGTRARWIALWQRRHGAWQFSVEDAARPVRLALDGGAGALEAVAAEAVGMSGVESERVSWRVLKQD